MLCVMCLATSCDHQALLLSSERCALGHTCLQTVDRYCLDPPQITTLGFVFHVLFVQRIWACCFENWILKDSAPRLVLLDAALSNDNSQIALGLGRHEDGNCFALDGCCLSSAFSIIHKSSFSAWTHLSAFPINFCIPRLTSGLLVPLLSLLRLHCTSAKFVHPPNVYEMGFQEASDHDL